MCPGCAMWQVIAVSRAMPLKGCPVSHGSWFVCLEPTNCTGTAGHWLATITHIETSDSSMSCSSLLTAPLIRHSNTGSQKKLNTLDSWTPAWAFVVVGVNRKDRSTTFVGWSGQNFRTLWRSPVLKTSRSARRREEGRCKVIVAGAYVNVVVPLCFAYVVHWSGSLCAFETQSARGYPDTWLDRPV